MLRLITICASWLVKLLVVSWTIAYVKKTLKATASQSFYDASSNRLFLIVAALLPAACTPSYKPSRKLLFLATKYSPAEAMLAPAASSSKPTEDKDDWINVPVVLGERSFDEERQADLGEIFQRGADQLRRHTAEWQQTVKRMRDNFVRLHPVDADQPATVVGESEKVRTLFFEYPPDPDGEDSALSGATSAERPPATRYQVRFDVSEYQPTSVTVTAELSTVVARATGESPDQFHTARVPVPPGVQRHRLRAFLSVDGVLTVEAPLVDGEVDAPPTTSVDNEDVHGSDNKWKRAKSAVMKAGGKTPDDADKICNGSADPDDEEDDGKEVDASSPDADATSPAEGQAGAPAKEKVGVPIFRDELGTRRMYLAVELGTIYRPRDVLIQVTVAGDDAALFCF